ncbi:DUF1295 domain-containing protein [Pseudochelatococcus lubricantis]|uniref:DUF1295 domain-containing protein n=1 Tax=Pseudochelatococcus lubricantis TaxID=1538102 RepID=UPI0035EA1123
MPAAVAFAATAIILSLAMTAAWAAVTRGAKSGWVDTTWSFLVGAAGVALALAPIRDWPADPARQRLVAALAAAWSLRLGLHIALRTARGADDPRYATLRRDWGAGWRGELFRFLQIQAAAALLLAGAIFLAARNPTPGLAWTDAAGIVIVLAAIAGEGIADAQLARFRKEPSNRGRICDAGLWGLSRHPNYFFQWLGWTGYAAIAIGTGGDYPWGWAALAGPVFMYWILVHASGIPPLEAHMLRERGEAYRAYQRRVNAFWPGRPRSD